MCSDAHEPFELEIVTRREHAETLIAVNVTGSVITIEHQTNYIPFIPPRELMVVTIPGLSAGNSKDQGEIR
jgi:hypothetical protein